MSDDDERSKLISDAVKLAVDASKVGADSLSEFLTAVADDAGNIAGKAGQQLRSLPSNDLAVRSGRLANDALSVALEMGVAARTELDKEPARRDRDLDNMSQLVSWVGSIFVDTANRAVGTAGGRPATNRPRQVSVAVPLGESRKVCAWVVNRGAITVDKAKVHILEDPARAGRVTADPAELTIAPRERSKVTLTVGTEGLEAGTFEDTLLVVNRVGSIVVRTIVTDPP